MNSNGDKWLAANVLGRTAPKTFPFFHGSYSPKAYCAPGTVWNYALKVLLFPATQGECLISERLSTCTCSRSKSLKVGTWIRTWSYFYSKAHASSWPRSHFYFNLTSESVLGQAIVTWMTTFLAASYRKTIHHSVINCCYRD